MNNTDVFSVTDALLNFQYIDPSVRISVSAIEGQDVALISHVTGNLPPSYSWWRVLSGVPKILGANSSVYILEPVDRSMAGVYECRATSVVGSGVTTVDFEVEYPPDVVVYYSPSRDALECNASGVPNSYTWLPWEQKLGETTVSTMPGWSTAPGLSMLPLTPDFNNTGLYICKVRNKHGIGCGTFFYRPMSKPVIEEYVCYDEKSRPVVPFYSYPEFTNVTWETDSGEIIHGGPTATRVQESTDVRVRVHGTRTSITGQAAVLVLEEDVPRDLVLTVTNGLGSSRVTVTRCPEYGVTMGFQQVKLLIGVLALVLISVALLVGICAWAIFIGKTPKRPQTTPASDVDDGVLYGSSRSTDL